MLFAGIASGEPPLDFDDPIALESTVTYADLLRTLCRGLEVNARKKSEATASECTPHRVMEPKMPAGSWEGATFSDLSRIEAKTLGKNRVLLTFTAPDVTMAIGIALFSLEPAPKLLDVIETTGAPDCVPRLHYDLRLTGAAEALVFTSSHGNVGFSDEQTTVVSLRGDHLEKVTTLFLKSCEHTPFAACDGGDVERTLAAGSVGGVLQLRVSERRPVPRSYQTTYRWDPTLKRYRATSNALASFIDGQ